MSTPKEAAYIWIKGDQIMVAFPGTVVADGHTVPFPASIKGLEAILAILRNRASRTDFASRGAPTRYAVERALVNDKRYNDLLRTAHAVSTADIEKLLEDL